ncbi:hypothetical protein EYC80_008206 [Monilinia laxa]|uniref:Uncharacterized protein n=1 Tax=Monilinia laxa TaxID=61186 RepID=A0A5N6JUJ4_MONLA|nr:hypothetical protein EYC80_008206 [Monilinia laxa]
MYAHPYLPVGSKEKWVCYVPILAHHNSFLLDSMLALSASHLSHNSPSTSPVTIKNYHVLSLHHRVLALRSLSELFVNLDPSTISQVQKQTMQATLYSLTFQSYYLSDLSGFFELLLESLFFGRLFQVYSNLSGDQVGRVLLAHFLAVQKIMGPIFNGEVEFNNTGSADGGLKVAEGIRGHKNWVESIWDELVEDKSREWEALMEWPRRVFSK